jgi:hypothetical protein
VRVTATIFLCQNHYEEACKIKPEILATINNNMPCGVALCLNRSTVLTVATVEIQSAWKEIKQDNRQRRTYFPIEKRKGRIKALYELMSDGEWRTLVEIHEILGGNPTSIGVQLKQFRRPEFGAWTISKRHRGPSSELCYEYKMELPF